MSAPKANWHTHTTWCDGAGGVEETILAAIAKGFDEIGFSSHAMLPGRLLDWTLDGTRGAAYAAEVRSLARKYAGRIRVRCGVEADFLPGGGDRAEPSREAYAAIAPDYIIGSVHFVRAADGAAVCVDKSPEDLAAGIAAHFGGDAREFVRAYYAQVREMLARFPVDIAGHLDLPRKFNARHPYFDENAAWHLAELEETADAAARSGALVEVNTGAISRGWLDDAYPSKTFRDMLRSRGARFVLSSDAHRADAIDCAFDVFGGAERYERLP